MADNDLPPAAISRRDFFASAAAGAALFTTAHAPRAWAMPTMARSDQRWRRTARFQRPNVGTDAGTAMLQSYEAGVRAMMALPPSDPRNWYRNALVHVLDCPHGNWWFLPWHRAYLGWFEQTIRVLSGNPDFALPFWDWTEQPSMPVRFFDGLLDPRNAVYIPSFADFNARFSDPVKAYWTSLSQRQLAQLTTRGFSSLGDVFTSIERSDFVPLGSARGLTRESPHLDEYTRRMVSRETIGSALRQQSFTRFASGRTANHSTSGIKGILESSPHDNVHGNVGGMMGAFLSPVDPIFFLHHANLDRLWSIWSTAQQQAGRPVVPSGAALAAWSAEPFLFFSTSSGTPVTLTRAGDYATATFFDYDYGTGFSPGAQSQAPAPAPRTIKSAILTPSMVLGQSAEARATVDAQMVHPAQEGLTAEITIEPAAGSGRARFHVFLNPPPGATTLTPQDPGFVGTLTPFGGTHHGTGPITFTLSLAPAIESLRRVNAFVPSEELRFEVVPDTQGAARRPVRAALRGVTLQSQ